MNGQEGPVTSVAVSADGKTIVSGTSVGTVRRWGIDGKPIGESISEQLGRVTGVTGVAISADGETIVSAGFDGTVRLRSVATNASWLFDTISPAMAVALTTDGQIIAGTQSGQILIFDVKPARLLAPPWAWPAGAVGVAFLLLSLRAWRNASDEIAEELTKAAGEIPVAAGFLDAEGPLEDIEAAGTAMKALVNRISTFIRNRDTTTPFTFAIAGEWGSGKSSVMRLVEKDLEKNGFPSVWFNAWHHQNEEHLFAALLDAVRTKATPSLMSLSAYAPRNIAFRVRLARERLKARPLAILLQGAAALFVVLLVWRLLGTAGSHTFPKLPEPVGFLGFASAGLLAACASLVAVIHPLRELLLPFLTKPAALLATADGWLTSRSFNERLGFRQTFASAFGEVCRAMGDRRLTLLIDDLDRCRPDRVVEVLEAVNFLTTSGSCFVVLGIADGPVKAAIGLAFKDVADERAAEARRRRGDTSTGDAYVSRSDYAQHYLEKLVTLRVAVPTFDAAALTDWLEHGGAKPRLASEGGGEQPSRSSRWVTGLLGLARVGLVLGLIGGLGLAVHLGANIVGSAIEKEMEKKPSKDEQATKPAATELPSPAPQRETKPADAAAPVTSGAPEPKDKAAEPDPLRRFERDRTLSFRRTVEPTVDMTSHLPWIALFWLTTGLLLFEPRLRRHALRLVSGVTSGVLSDSGAYRASFEQWVSLVLEARKSPRAIKRFANRMRYVTSGIRHKDGAGLVADLVALGALHEAGLIGFDGGFDQIARIAETRGDALDDRKRGQLRDMPSDHWLEYWAREGHGHSSENAPRSLSPIGALMWKC